MKTYILILEDKNDLYADYLLKIKAEDIENIKNKIENFNVNDFLKASKDFNDSDYDFEIKYAVDYESVNEIMV